MNKPLLKLQLESFKETNFVVSLRDFSPIHKENSITSSKTSKQENEKKDEISPGSGKTCPNSFLKSFSSYHSENMVLDLGEIEEITERVKRMEDNLDINLLLLKEKLELNKQLNEKIMILEDLKKKNKKFFDNDREK
jgi:hypothetical protein